MKADKRMAVKAVLITAGFWCLGYAIAAHSFMLSRIFDGIGMILLLLVIVFL